MSKLQKKYCILGFLQNRAEMGTLRSQQVVKICWFSSEDFGIIGMNESELQCRCLPQVCPCQTRNHASSTSVSFAVRIQPMQKADISSSTSRHWGLQVLWQLCH